MAENKGVDLDINKYLEYVILAHLGILIDFYLFICYSTAMTENEKKQPKYVFVSAGKHAFQIGVEFIDNPYKQEPFRTLWAKGYMSERRKYTAVKRLKFNKRVAHAHAT